MSVRNKVLATDFEAWNHPRLAAASVPVLAVVGFAAGSLVVPHLVPADPGRTLATALFGGVTLLLGVALLALLD